MIWLVSRHHAALHWVLAQGLAVGRVVAHLDPTAVRAGDTVVGTLPVQSIADICSRGAHYLHLVLDLPEHMRGTELTLEQLDALGARLEQFRAERIHPS